MKTHTHPLLRRLVMAALLTLSLPLTAQTGTVLKLHARNTLPQTTPKFGAAAAMNETWIVIGEPSNDDINDNSGAAHVFSPLTGAFVRKLANPASKSGAQFGTSVAVSGDLALIGSPGAGSYGAVYLYNLKTGTLLRSISGVSPENATMGTSVALDGVIAAIGDIKGVTANGTTGLVQIVRNIIDASSAPISVVPADVQDGDRWGYSLAVRGGLLLAGAPNQNADAGAAYLFDANTNTQLRKFTGSGDERVGTSVALSAGRAILGAPGYDAPAANTGLIKCYSLASGNLITSPTSFLGGGAQLGTTIAAWGTQIVSGAPLASASPVTSSGRAEVYPSNGTSGVTPLSFIPTDRAPFDAFGTAVAVWGNRVLVTSPDDDDLGTDTGSAYLWTAVPLSMKMTPLGTTSSFAPGLVDVRHAKLIEGHVSSGSRVIFSSTLTGSSLPGGTGVGVFTTGPATGTPALALSTGRDLAGLGLPGVKATALSQLNAREGSKLVFQAKLAGAGVTAATDTLVLADDGTSVYPLIRKGAAIPLLGGAILNQWTTLSQPNSTGPLLLSLLRPGVAGVTTANDSTILKLDSSGVVTGKIREGDMASVGVPFGSMTRIDTAPGQMTVLNTALQSPTTTNSALFNVNLMSMTHSLIARKGDPAPGIAGGVFSTFIGETYASLYFCMRATVSGAGITAANNDGIWSTRTGTLALVARTGTQVDGLTAGITWVKFLGCWPTSGKAVMLHAQIKGPGVTSANDTVLWVSQEDGSSLLLLREGDLVEGATPYKLGVIQRATLHLNQGHYAVLAALVGAPADRNQVLLTGSLSDAPINLSVLRKPFVRMQKGTLYDRQQGVVSRLTSINWSGNATEPMSLGGQGKAMSNTLLVLQLGYTNGTSEMTWGQP